MSRRTISRWLFLVMSASVLLLATGAATGGASRVSRGSVLWAAVAAPPAPPPPEAASPAAVAALQQAVAAWLPAFDRAAHWISADTVTVQRSEASGGLAVAYLLVEQSHRLDLRSPQDSPVLQGFRDFLATHGSGLNAAQRAVVEQRMAEWAARLQGYIDQPFVGYLGMKATGALAPDGGVVPGSVELYVDGGEGDYIPAAQLLGRIRSPAAVQAEVAEGLVSTMAQIGATLAKPRAQQAAQGATAPSPQCVAGNGWCNWYRGGDAAVYANQYTSNATTRVWCSANDSALQDTYYWNHSYQGFNCNDCANYASQSMNHGSLPTDGTWMPYTRTWTYVPYLRTYMEETKGYWASESYSQAAPGDALTLGSKLNEYHVEMVVYNDGTVLKTSAHTDDRLDLVWSGSADPYTFWWVSWWV